MRILFLIFFVLYGLPALGMEVYRTLDQHCKGPTGLILQADTENLKILRLDGELEEVRVDDIHYVLVYYSLENPITKVHLAEQMTELVKEVHTNDSTVPSFTGWPVKFVDDGVVFFNLEGNLSLVGVEKIQSIQKYQAKQEVWSFPGKLNHPRFVLDQGFPGCTPEASGPADLRPTLVMGDKIKIHKFLSSYIEGHEKLRRFQQRTQFYARPFVFPKQTRLGFPNMGPNQNQELPAFLPVYVQWSSGKSFSNQALTGFGSKPSPWLPQLEPVTGIQADLKSHFFNASFAGNLMGIAKGSDFLVKNRAFYTDFYSRTSKKEVMIMPSFNHFAMSGVDYGPYSVSLGIYHPVYAVQGGGVFREVTHRSAGPMLRLMKQSSNDRWRLVMANSGASSSSPKVEEIRLYSTLALTESRLYVDEDKVRADLSQFSLKMSYVRLGYDLEWDEELDFSVDGIWLWGRYEEVYQNRLQSLKTGQLMVGLKSNHRFGSYVELTGQLNLFGRNYDAVFNDSPTSVSEQAYSMVVTLDFFL